MSDDHSRQPAGEDSSESGASADAGAGPSSDGLEPGGGPQRVVSEQSVDDILNSLDATKSKAATDSSESATASGSTTVEFDEDETSPTDGDGDDADSGADASDPETDTGDAADAADETTDAVENSAVANASAESTADAPSVEEAAASIPDDDSLEDLAARVETGAVTGADVRAAEAGEGRESTPEVDEIDLSMDDLEATRSHSGTDASGSAASAPDDGPLAGTIPRDDGDSSGDADDTDESPGLFGRIKRFFGG